MGTALATRYERLANGDLNDWPRASLRAGLCGERGSAPFAAPVTGLRSACIPVGHDLDHDDHTRAVGEHIGE